MKRIETIFAAAAFALAMGCGDYAGGDQRTAQQNESSEPANFGSATDIRGNGEQVTNDLNAADVGIGGPLQRASGNFQSQPVPGQTSDDELARKVKVALSTGSMGTTGVIAKDQLTEIDVSVQNGVVTLLGPVMSEYEKRTIEKQVSGMKGVTSVRNELTIQSEAAPKAPLDPLVPRN